MVERARGTTGTSLTRCSGGWGPPARTPSGSWHAPSPLQSLPMASHRDEEWAGDTEASSDLTREVVPVDHGQPDVSKAPSGWMSCSLSSAATPS